MAGDSNRFLADCFLRVVVLVAFLKLKFKYYKTALAHYGKTMSGDLRKQIVTSLRVNSELWKEAKVQAIRRDMTLTELVEEAISLWMQEKMNESKP